MVLRTVATVVLVVLAGCTAVPVGQPGAPSGSPSADAPASGSPTPTWSGDRDNPWRERTLTVALAHNGSRDVRPLVREALAYWGENADRYAGYPVGYDLDPDAPDPDIVVRFVASVESCGTETHVAGCAPVLTAPGQVDRPVTVEVRTGLSDDSTVQVVKHELGHTLGLVHGDEPRTVMAASSNLTTLPQPDATERALPWDSPELSVFVDLSSVPPGERDAARRQIRAALDYYAAGAEGTVPGNVSFVRTDNRTAADVVIRFGSTAACGADGGSCGTVSGQDPDGDGALETYSRLEVTLVDLDTEAVAWHVGRWLGTGFGFDDEAEYPEPLRERATYEERRSEWWT